jgi:hypothetical protein
VTQAQGQDGQQGQQGGQQGGDGQQSQQGQQGQQGGGTPPLNFDAWLGSQDETVRGLIDSHTKGLKGALESERTQRKDFEKQLRDAAGKLEKGSEAEKQVTALADQVKSANGRADFYEAASAAGCTNLKLAWLAVQQDADLTDSKGNVRMDALKTAFPELFKSAAPRVPGNAGSGAGQGNAAPNMNAIIRQAAGR